MDGLVAINFGHRIDGIGACLTELPSEDIFDVCEDGLQVHHTLSDPPFIDSGGWMGSLRLISAIGSMVSELV
jgi:hypothetical protein